MAESIRCNVNPQRLLKCLESVNKEVTADGTGKLFGFLEHEQGIDYGVCQPVVLKADGGLILMVCHTEYRGSIAVK